MNQTQIEIYTPIIRDIMNQLFNSSNVSEVQESIEAPIITSFHVDLNRLRILVVEDDEIIRKLIVEILKCEGYDPVEAIDGEDGLKKFKASKFDAVFTDIIMPKMDGWALINSIRKINTKIPIAVVTGWPETVDNAENAGKAGWVISKPFSTQSLIGLAAEISLLRQ
jgi:CheY-like chemotaxis protein